MRKRALLMGATIAVAPFASAFDLGLAGQFNAFVFNNANTAGGHSEGAIAIKGNWTGSGYDTLQHNHPATVGSDNKIGFYVGGNINYSNGGSVNNSGNGRVGGNFFTQNTFNMNGGTLFIGGTKTGNVNGGWVAGTNTVDMNVFTTQQAYSQAQNNAIAALGGEAINTSDLNNWNVNTALQSGSQKVYQISGASLNNLRTLNFNNLQANDTVMINVTGGSVNGFGITVNTSTGVYNKILWNFTGTTFNVTDRSLHGSLLAPNAVVTQNRNIDGNLIAWDWNNQNSNQLHYANFTGNAVPEPATMAALGLGVAAILRDAAARSSLIPSGAYLCPSAA